MAWIDTAPRLRTPRRRRRTTVRVYYRRGLIGSSITLFAWLCAVLGVATWYLLVLEFWLAELLLWWCARFYYGAFLVIRQALR